ncbi:MAG: mitochondrial import inner membrane translocase subunit tim54 [Alectoria sarmentosa]|nr:MAG: mitochondrial import inner membrane translocase subunit tim54 [Alectoria sarmentosa]
MAEKPPSKDASPATSSKVVGNPALRMMGLPNLKFKLPSRNWLIFWTMTGSFTSMLLYDRYHKKKAQRKWCALVSHLAQEPLPVNMMPRRITIFLAAPPGDGLRVSRDHFHEYIKPILIAGAMDWDVIEGRREGEVRAGLAEKIRKLRKRNGEVSQVEAGEESQEDLYAEMRKRSGITDWDGVQGDLVLGRHTWKEYIRGLHEGWLGPLDEAQRPQSERTDVQPLAAHSPDSPLSGLSPSEASSSETPSSLPLQTDSPKPESPPKKNEEKPAKPPITPPYITPSEYASSPLAPTLPTYLPPSLPVALPHLLGFFNFPIRIYRFLTRRHLADSTGASVAALVLASRPRPFTQSTDFDSAIDPDDASPGIDNQTDNALTQTEGTWEQEAVLREEESEWHKSAWKANEEGDTRERLWQERMVVDGKIGEKMRRFELPSGQEDEAAKLDAEKRQENEGYIARAKKWAGLESEEKRGWEMGLEGDETS